MITDMNTGSCVELPVVLGVVDRLRVEDSCDADPQSLPSILVRLHVMDCKEFFISILPSCTSLWHIVRGWKIRIGVGGVLATVAELPFPRLDIAFIFGMSMSQSLQVLSTVGTLLSTSVSFMVLTPVCEAPSVAVSPFIFCCKVFGL